VAAVDAAEDEDGAPAASDDAAGSTTTADADEHGETHSHEGDEPHVDDYGFSFITGLALVLGVTGTILGLAALLLLRSRV
jgi:hypothetical protein